MVSIISTIAGVITTNATRLAQDGTWHKQLSVVLGLIRSGPDGVFDCRADDPATEIEGEDGNEKPI